jgi:Tol biopolymer transport system component
VGTRDIWFYDVGSGARSRFTSEAADENWLVWSADGSRAIFNSFAPGGFQLFESSASNAAERRSLVSGGAGKWPVSWSRDGRFLLYVTNDRPSSNDIWALPLPFDAGKPPFRYQVTDASENWATFAPDGKWVAFSSAESGQAAVYVAPFPQNGRRWRVSAGGGSQARWRRDGRELYYLAPDRTLMAATVTITNGEVAVAGTESLFRLTFPYGAYHAFDVTSDGTRFLVNTTIVSPRGSGNVASRASRPESARFAVVR